MQVSVQDQGSIGRKIIITVPSEEFQARVNKQLNRYRKNAKIAGFRKGKVPQKILEQQFGGQAASEAIDATINETYPQALKDNDIMPAGLLKITPTQVNKGEDFIYEADIEIYPEVPAPSLKGVEVKRPEVEVSGSDIDRTIENIQQKQTKYHAADKAAESGDQVTMDFVGTIDGEPFQGGEGKDIEVVLGEGRFLETFEKHLFGASEGDTKTGDVTFPDDYPGTDVAGKTAQFEIIIKAVKAPEVPELNDGFATEMGVVGGMDKLREEVREGLQRELNTRMRSYVRDQVMDSLAKTADFDLPKALVDEEVDRAMKEVTAQMEQQGMQVPKESIKRENYLPQSEHRVKLGLIVREVVESQNIEMGEEKIRQRAAEMAGNYSDQDAYVDYVMGDPNQRNQIGGVLVEEQVVENLLENADIKVDKQSYEDFMNETQPNYGG